MRLGFSYVFASLAGRDRLPTDARDEFTAARDLAPGRAAAHVGLGILRFDERSANRAKNEFLASLEERSRERAGARVSWRNSTRAISTIRNAA